MNTSPEPAGQQRTRPQLSEAAKASLAKTHTLFRMFVVSVLGAFFVYQLDVNYLWLTGILTAASVAARSVYDMCKAVDRGMEISGVLLLDKRGGRIGHWRAGEA